MKVGMTGNRYGMSKQAKQTFQDILAEGEYNELHHGDCKGADADAHDLATFFELKTVAHPPIDESLRAFKKADIILPQKQYFVRNRAIVDSTQILFGFPLTMRKTKGGTWYTMGYAIKQNRPLTIIWPNGTVKEYNQG